MSEMFQRYPTEDPGSAIVRVAAPLPPTPARPAEPRPAAARISGRPTYAGGLTSTFLRNTFNTETFGAFYANIPVLKRTIEILTGLVGCPILKTSSEAATANLKEWSQNVQTGHIGQGLGMWLRDHLGQALIYGFGVGEAQPDEARGEIVRLWSYRSPYFRFETDEWGAITVKQRTSAGELTLDPVTAVVSTHSAQGMNPQGESFFLAIPNVAQILVDALHAYRETWRRNGIPTFHIHTQLPDSMALDDPDGTIAGQINAQVAAQWNAGVRAQYVNGQAQDFITCNVGATTVKMIGEDGPIMDMSEANKTLMEHILSATGIPPFMFGLSWATTERMSKQQADMLLSLIDMLRAEVTPAVRHVVDLRQRLALQREGLTYELDWPDVNLFDLEATARAEMLDAGADLSREKFWATGWRNGVIDQKRYAKEVFGVDQVETEMRAPVAVSQGGEQPPREDQRLEGVLTTLTVEALAGAR